MESSLEPHPNGMVQMNMYEVQDNQTSGFGPFSLTYLTVEIAGHDSYAAEGAQRRPVVIQGTLTIEQNSDENLMGTARSFDGGRDGSFKKVANRV
jgi:hypothetical protein